MIRGIAMYNKIYWIGGSKGGVGKSIVTMAMIDYLQSRTDKILLIETDTSNPDVYRAYNDEVDTKLLNLDKSDGWIDLVNVCDKMHENIVVINTAARNNTSVRAYGETINNTLEELKRKLITLWVINRQRDSLELLNQYCDTIRSGNIHVLRNKYYGDVDKFELYNDSNLRKAIEARGGKSLTFPDLADRVSDDIYTRRLSISRAARELPIGNRAELMRWRNEVKRVFDEIIMPEAETDERT